MVRGMCSGLPPRSRVLIFSSAGFRPCHPIHQINQPVVVDATVLGQADFAGAAGGNALAAVLHGVLERTQRMAVQLRCGEAFVAGKSAAMYAFGNHHGVAAFARQIDQRLAFAQVLSAAGHVDGNRRFLGCEVQTIQQMRTDEAHRIVQIQSCFADVLNQSQRTRAGVAIDRVEAAATGVEQCADQLLTFVLGLFGVAFGGEWLAAAEVVLIVGKDYLVTGLFQQATGFVVQRHLLSVTRRRAHDPRHASCQINHARALVGHARAEANGFFRLWHGVGPQRDLAFGLARQRRRQLRQTRCAEHHSCTVGDVQGEARAL